MTPPAVNIAVASPDPADGFDPSALARALIDYLHEIDADYQTCLKHESAVGVCDLGSDLRLIRLFAATDAVVTSLRDGVDRLPRRLCCTAPGPVGSRGRGQETRHVSDAEADGSPTAVLSRWVDWDGCPVLITAGRPNRTEVLRVELLLPQVRRDLPELPILRVARGLRCHDHLVPERVADPIPIAHYLHPDAEPLLGYLRRATPRNLYASHCLFPEGVEY